MKTSATIRIVIYSVLALFLAAILVNGLTGESFFGIKIGEKLKLPFSNLSIGYEDAEKCTIGGGSVPQSAISEMDINWIAGNVKIEVWEKDTIEFSENYTGNSQSDKMRYYVDDGKLIIQYREGGRLINNSLKGKQLTIKVPKGKIFDDFEIDSVSSDINIRGVVGRELSIDNVSGEIDIEDVEFDRTSINSVSGSIDVMGKLSAVDCEAVSGRIVIESSICPDRVDFQSVSGSVTLKIPENDGFTARYNSVSGRFDCDFGVALDKKTAVYKEGSAKFDFETVSGKMSIYKK